MSKIICEVCGTAYPEASTQCPICGCVRPADANGVPSGPEEKAPERTYLHVKGGRFSKANVRKRTTASQNGSHVKLKNSKTNRQTIVPMHNKDLKKGLEEAILKQAGLK